VQQATNKLTINIKYRTGRKKERRPVYSNRKEPEVQPTKPPRFAAAAPPHSPFLSLFTFQFEELNFSLG